MIKRHKQGHITQLLLMAVIYSCEMLTGKHKKIEQNLTYITGLGVPTEFSVPMTFGYTIPKGISGLSNLSSVTFLLLAKDMQPL